MRCDRRELAAPSDQPLRTNPFRNRSLATPPCLPSPRQTAGTRRPEAMKDVPPVTCPRVHHRLAYWRCTDHRSARAISTKLLRERNLETTKRQDGIHLHRGHPDGRSAFRRRRRPTPCPPDTPRNPITPIQHTLSSNRFAGASRQQRPLPSARTSRLRFWQASCASSLVAAGWVGPW
jgi:hypothetical protein